MAKYVVKAGDNLTKIARKYKMKWRDLYNHAQNAEFRRKRPNPNVIMPGDVLYVPGGSTGGGGQVLDLGETVITSHKPQNKSPIIKKTAVKDQQKILDETLDNLPFELRRSLSNFIRWGGYGMKGIQLIELVVVSPAMATVAGSIGGVLGAIGSVLSVIAAWETNKRMYGYRAYAYTTTAWAFNKPRPTSSPEMMKRFKNFSSDNKVQERHAAWQDMSNRTWNNLAKLCKEKNVSKETWQMALKYAAFEYKGHSGNLQQKLCHLLMKSCEGNFGNGVSRDSWKDGYSTLYPK